MKEFLKKIVVFILTLEARQALKRHKPGIIAVTGSVGKTSTKDAIYTVISSVFETRKSQKSMNSEIGLPLTVLGLENAWSNVSGWLKNILKGARTAFFDNEFPKWLVLEVGADHPGDIEKTGKWLHPDIVVLTRMSEVPVHVEFFQSAEEVLREKMFLAQALKPNGTLVVNADDVYFSKAVLNLPVKKVTYGASKTADVKIDGTGVLYSNDKLSLPHGQYGVFETRGQKEKIEIMGVLGDHLMYPIAAAYSVANVLNININPSDLFKQSNTPRGRMRVLSGKSGSVIIDDTYNSSPIASVEALKTLKNLSVRGKKIAVLADMKELGSYSKEAHREIGKLAGETLHTLITVGEMAKDIAFGAREMGMSSDRVLSFNTFIEAIPSISQILRASDVILVKGSQSMRMEKLVESILEDPSKAGELLVRQEEEWKKR